MPTTPRTGRLFVGFAALLAFAIPLLVAASEPEASAPPVPVPATTPTAGASARGSLTVPFLSPNGRTEESLTVRIAPILDGPRGGAGKTLVEKKVTLPPRPKSTRVTFEDLPAGRWLLSWSGLSLSAGERSFVIGAAPLVGAEIALKAGRTLHGSVRDDGGMVLPGVEVRAGAAGEPYVDSPLPSVTARSEPDGTFVLTGLPVDAKLWWSANAEGHVPASGLVGGETRLEVVLERAQLVTGRVVDSDGKPIEGAGVVPGYVLKGEDGRVRSTGGHPGPIRTDEMGRFAFHRTLLWPGNVHVRARGVLPESVPLEAISSFSERRELDLGTITLRKGRVVSGRVIAAKGGAPVPNARVEARWEVGERIAAFRERAEATSGPDGTFELTGLPFGEGVRLVALAPSFSPRSIVLAAEATSVDLTLSAGGRIEGQVCGTAAELARSWIWYGSGGEPVSSGNEIEVGPDGRFVVENAEAGPWKLMRAWKFRDATGAMRGGSGGVTSASSRLTVEEGATTHTRLACDGIPVTGILKANGAPLGDRVLVLSKNDREFGSGFVDAATGAFTIRVPTPGPYRSWGSTPPEGTTFASPGCEVPPEGLAGCVVNLTPVAQ